MKFLSFCFLPFLTPLERLIIQDQFKVFANKELSPTDRLLDEMIDIHGNLHASETLNTFLLLSFLLNKKNAKKNPKQYNRRVPSLFFIASVCINFTRNIHPVL